MVLLWFVKSVWSYRCEILKKNINLQKSNKVQGDLASNCKKPDELRGLWYLTAFSTPEPCNCFFNHKKKYGEMNNLSRSYKKRQ